VIEYTLYDQNVAFAVCVTVTYWEVWKKVTSQSWELSNFTLNFHLLCN